MAKEKRDSLLGGFLWKFAERSLAQAVSFVVSLVLARLLAPEAFGMIAVILVFITLADALVLHGVGNALVQKKDCDDTDFSSVFYFNIVFSLLIYAAIFVAAPYIEAWYGASYAGLALALQVLALRVPISAINNVQHAYVSRKMIFRKFFLATLVGTLGAAAVGISLALMGYGVWALVFQYLFNAVVNTVVLCFTVSWRPRLLFSFARLGGLLRFGWKLMFGSILEVLYNDLRTILIGKVYTSADLAYYDRGKQFPGLVVDNINTSILSVMFPALCSIQDNKEEMKKTVRRAAGMSCYIIAPMLIGLAAVSERLVVVLLTEKWLVAAWFVPVFCLIYLFQPISKPAQQIINARGRSDVSLYLQILTKVVGVAGIVISIPMGVKAVAIAHAATSIFGYLLDMYVGGRMVQYPLWEQLRDIFPALAFSAVMGIAVYAVGMGLGAWNDCLVLAVQVLSGFVIYVILSLISGNDSFKLILSKGMNLFKANK